jgi:hypothetical protein
MIIVYLNQANHFLTSAAEHFSPNFLHIRDAFSGLFIIFMRFGKALPGQVVFVSKTLNIIDSQSRN